MKKSKMTEGDIHSLIEEIHLIGGSGSLAANAATQYKHNDMEALLAEYKEDFLDVQINEIRRGLEQLLPVEIFAKTCYNWMQMRELRLGLLEGLDISYYENPLFMAEQMKEIRMGLMDHLPVQEYAKLVLSTTDMREKRQELLCAAYKEHPTGYEKYMTDDETGLQFRISDDYLRAYVFIQEKNWRKYTESEIRAALRRNGICDSFIFGDVVEKLAKGRYRGEEVLIAEGKAPEEGKNGSYELLFEEHLPGVPTITKDGRADYTNVMVAATVEEDQQIVKYHPARNARKGKTVTGLEIAGNIGEELKPLVGKGFYRSHRNGHYYAAVTGHVSFEEESGILNVVEVLVISHDLTRINGNIVYEGSVHVMGNVSDSVQIRAGKDIIIDGYVESANLYAGKNIMIRRGVNAAGNGYIEAGGRIMGSFFEDVVLKAKGDIEGNYFMNCEVESRGKVEAKGGKSRIIGGSIKAIVGVETAVLGSPGGNRTEVDVGDTLAVQGDYDYCMKKLGDIQKELNDLRAARAQLLAMAEHDSMNQDLMMKVLDAIGIKETEFIEVKAEADAVERLRIQAQHAHVLVRARVYENVVVVIDGVHKKIRSDMHQADFTREKIQ